MRYITGVIFLCLFLLFGCSTRQDYRGAEDKPALSANTVNINTASAAEIEKLPGIGRKTAEAIVAFREQNGPFRRPEGLMLIRGVSESRFAEFRQFIRTE